jgi:putative phosphoesterase
MGGESFRGRTGLNGQVTVVGVISDTHGLLRPEAVEALRGSAHILHAGDIGAREILEKLRAIAPVTAVRGNVDRESWTRSIPQSQVVEIAGASIYMLHILAELDLKPEAAGFAAVVYGHSHQPSQEMKGGVLYFNPGSAGPRRFKLPITVGKLLIENGSVRGEIICIDGQAAPS